MWEFFKKPKNTKQTQEEKLKNALLKEILDEAIQKSPEYGVSALSDLKSYAKVKSVSTNELKELLFSAWSLLLEYNKAYQKPRHYLDNRFKKEQILSLLLNALFKREIGLSTDELTQLLEQGINEIGPDLFIRNLPHSSLLSRLEDSIKIHGCNHRLKKVLEALLTNEDEYTPYGINTRLNDYINYLISGAPILRIDEGDPFGKSMAESIRNLKSDSLRESWQEFIQHCASAENKANPSGKWIKECMEYINRIGGTSLGSAMEEWLSICCEMLRQIHREAKYEFKYLKDINHTILKGLIWSAGLLNQAIITSKLEEYGLLAFKKLPSVGAVSVRTGNACLYALSILPYTEGISRLSKFKTKIKYPSVIKQVEKYILAVAEKEGYSADELEEISIPDLNIKNSTWQKQLDDYTALIEIDSNGETELVWLKSGKKQNSVPVTIKNNFGPELKEIRNQKKEIDSQIPVQKNRIESFYLKSRTWKYDNWYTYYIKHDLVRVIATKLIWHFSTTDRKTTGIYFKDKFIDVDGNEIGWLNSNTTVQLWHPIGFSEKEVLKWRTFIDENKIKQPFKQAYREIYIVTPAEVNTEVYSNRFAAHILRQHQFIALCKQRRWKYSLMGGWDSHNTPTLEISHLKITAEFLVDAEWESDSINSAGIFSYVNTDQVRFFEKGEQLNMQDVPAMVFTEVMRDVDLFVGVCSIGNDPSWQDGGNQVTDSYWRKYSIEELSESAKVRSEALKRIIAKLKISDRCTFDQKNLIVEGKIKTYKIHMGSGNILMSPNDQYLCIVPGKKTNTEKVFLPFEGDGLLSIILSKAILLADDDKITDKTITSQIWNS